MKLFLLVKPVEKKKDGKTKAKTQSSATIQEVYKEKNQLTPTPHWQLVLTFDEEKRKNTC